MDLDISRKINQTEFKNGIQNLWGKITDEEFDSTKGDLNKLVNLITRKYLIRVDEIQDRIEKLLASFDNNTDRGFSPDRSSFERGP